MTTLTLFLVFLPAWEVPSWVPGELRDTARFRVLNSSERRWRVERADGVQITLSHVAPSSPVQASVPLLMSEISPRHFVMPYSTLPLGRQLHVRQDRGKLLVYTVGAWEQLHFDMSAPILSEGGRRFNRPDDLAAEGRWAEAIARKAFAAYASRRLGPAETIAVNGRSVASRRAERSNAEMVDLEAWASATGASLTRDPNGDAWTLVRGGVSRLFALGADKVKAGGVWKPMPDAPMLKDGRVFVPRDGLSN